MSTDDLRALAQRVRSHLQGLEKAIRKGHQAKARERLAAAVAIRNGARTTNHDRKTIRKFEKEIDRGIDRGEQQIKNLVHKESKK